MDFPFCSIFSLLVNVGLHLTIVLQQLPPQPNVAIEAFNLSREESVPVNYDTIYC